MNRLRITGPFYFIRWACIDRETADGLVSGSLEKNEVFYDIEALPSYRSLYGAVDPAVYLNDDLLICAQDQTIDAAAANQLANGYDPSPEISDQFVTTSVHLQPGRGDAFFISFEKCEGDEYRDFDGAYDSQNLSVRKVTFRVGEEIETLYQINYKEANIVDETQSDYDGFYVYNDGVLIGLE